MLAGIRIGIGNSLDFRWGLSCPRMCGIGNNKIKIEVSGVNYGNCRVSELDHGGCD